MKKHFDTVISRTGTPVSGATVNVYAAGTTTPSTIYSDNGVTTKANPTSTNTNGYYEFYVADGLYDILITKSGHDSVTLTNVLIEEASTIDTAAPVTNTTATYTVASSVTSVIANYAGTTTLTLPAAASYTGRILFVRTIQAQTVVSASSNVVPVAGGAAGTAILAATAGKWAMLQSDGTNWQIMAAG